MGLDKAFVKFVQQVYASLCNNFMLVASILAIITSKAWEIRKNFSKKILARLTERARSGVKTSAG